MKIVGEKLKIARQIRNKTITQLAKEVEVSKQAISQYESELIEPKGEILSKICNVLSFPLFFFINPFKEEITVSNTFFRALNSTPALERNSYFEKAKLVSRIYNYLEDILILPKLNIPRFQVSDNISEYEIEKLASNLRQYWGLGEEPIYDVVSLLERNGVIVSVLKSESKKIDGFTQVYKSNGKLRYCVILDDEKHSMARRNFSAAHELGHIILHTYINPEEFETDRIKIEKQANKFASSFLLPRNSFKKDLVNPLNYELYVTLKLKWRVSIQAMIMRAKDLGLIDYYQYTSLFKKYNYKITHSNLPGEKYEPFDNDGKISFEQPELFETALELSLGNKKTDYYFMQEHLKELGIALDDDFLCSILPIPDNFFDKYQVRDKILKIKLK